MTIEASTRVRLDRPAIAVWRAPGVLQVGIDDPSVVLEGVPRALADAVPLLAHPCTTEELATLLPRLDPEWLPWLVDRLGSAGLLATATPVVEPSILVVGAGPLAAAVAHAVAVGGRHVDRLDPVGFAALPSRPDAPELVLLATGTAEPDRALTDALFREGRAHLVVRLEPDRAVVGPLVVPGSTPCVRCSDFVRGHLDPAWPHLLAQLCREGVEPVPALRTWAASTAAVQVHAWQAGAAADASGASLELTLPDYRLRRRAWPAHPACGCLLTPG
ncbi:MAG: hypothetical protein QM779_03645 [Propionicimonas sp.]|uniref:hypothetical protein n=1 Tax=Propionicimonas sp. TaxID=1955623 RepID=UPI003D0D8441